MLESFYNAINEGRPGVLGIWCTEDFTLTVRYLESKVGPFRSKK